MSYDAVDALGDLAWVQSRTTGAHPGGYRLTRRNVDELTRRLASIERYLVGVGMAERGIPAPSRVEDVSS